MPDRSKKLLIIEDDLSLLEALRDKLREEGLSVLEAKNGQEGLEILLREHPDLTLLDLAMPKMDGMTMLKKLREDAWGRDAKVLILTNVGDSEKISSAVKLGAYDFLIKADWKMADIVQKVHQRLI